MKIAFYPSHIKNENISINKVAQAIKLAYPKVELTTLPRFRDILKSNLDFEIAWLNWFENLSSSPLSFFKEIIIKYLVLRKFKQNNIKIFTFFHNKEPHDSFISFIAKKFYKNLLKKSDYILIHSDQSKEIIKKYLGDDSLKKVKKISHPSYDIIPYNRINNQNNEFNVLFFGALRPYKNIELIFKLAQNNPDINFTIAGRPFNKKYERKLKRMAEGLNNTNLILGFLDNEEIESLISKSEILILPYNQHSSLNSGVLFYAFSHGINVIIPDIASVNEFENKESIYYYSYNKKKDHLLTLHKTLLSALNDYKVNKNLFYQRAQILQKEVSKFTVEYLSQQIIETQILIQKD